MTIVTCVRCADVTERPPALRARDLLAARDLGDDLDPERYAAIQAAMWRHPLSRAALRVWVLEHDGAVVATFDTLDVTVRLRDAAGAALTRTGACIASGFVAPEHRLAGHGRHLAGELSRRLAREGHALVYGVVETTMKVYREIDAGTSALTEVAWPAEPVLEVIPRRPPSDPLALADHAVAAAGSVGGGGGVGGDVPEQLRDLAAWTDPPPPAGLDILVTAEMLDWRLERVALERPQDRGRPIGARLGDAMVVWASAPERAALELLHLRGDARVLAALVDAARREAAARGLRHAVAWETPTLAPHLPPGERRRVDALLGVRTFHPDLVAAAWQDAQIGHYF
ncbi:MAG: hypothetical protein JNL82_01125 [Myxococcales bacterium]|nr:hypothetical protein [Myxococcales bacterium]